MNVTKQQAKEAFKVLEQYFKQQEVKSYYLKDWIKIVPASQELVSIIYEIDRDSLIALNIVDDCDIYEYLGYSEVSKQLTDEFIELRMTYNEDGSMNNVDRYAKTIRQAEADIEFSKRMQNKCN